MRLAHHAEMASHRGRWSQTNLFECSTHPGELLIVPDRWWHATENHGEVHRQGREPWSSAAALPLKDQ